MSIGTRISSMRGFRRLNQEQLGGLIGVTKQTISGWEHDRRTPDAESIIALCKALDCSADYMLGLADEPHGHIKF